MLVVDILRLINIKQLLEKIAKISDSVVKRQVKEMNFVIPLAQNSTGLQ